MGALPKVFHIISTVFNIVMISAVDQKKNLHEKLQFLSVTLNCLNTIEFELLFTRLSQSHSVRLIILLTFPIESNGIDYNTNQNK